MNFIKKRNQFLIFTFVILTACSHAPGKRDPSQSSCDFNPLETHEKISSDPFMKEFSKPDGTIVFIAAAHGEESNNKATFDLIRSAFNKYLFQRTIVEGLENAEGISPENYLSEIKTGQRKLGEPAFLALESNKRGIEFTGGEVSDKELLELIRQKGFSRKDMAGFYILRSWTKDPSMTLGRMMDSKRFPIEGQFKSTEEFHSWFKQISGQDNAPTKDPKLSMPFQRRNDRLQLLANEITWARDRFLSKVISDAYREKKKVLVVYGSGHYLPQKCFLETW